MAGIAGVGTLRLVAYAPIVGEVVAGEKARGVDKPDSEEFAVVAYVSGLSAAGFVACFLKRGVNSSAEDSELTLFSLLLSNNSISPFIDDFGFAFDFDSILLLDCDLFFPFFLISWLQPTTWGSSTGNAGTELSFFNNSVLFLLKTLSKSITS